MIKKNTVFVLGAGASVPYGYPSGETLLKKINDLSSDNLFLNLVDEITNTQNPIREGNLREDFEAFSVDLAASGLLSVDSFVVVKPQYSLISKFAITYILLTAENINKYSVSENEDWYRYLYHNFIDKKSFEDICKSQISFITFNYDVSIDGFFFRAINSKFPGKAKEFFDNIKVIHAHGRIRSFPWEQGPTRITRRNFDFDMNEKFYVWNSSLGIKFAFEEASQAAIQEAQILLKKAQAVYFLGFGFHADNMQKLNIDWMNAYKPNTHTKYIGTVFKFTNSEIKKIINDVHGFNDRSGEILLNLEQKNNLDLIRNYADVI